GEKLFWQRHEGAFRSLGEEQRAVLDPLQLLGNLPMQTRRFISGIRVADEVNSDARRIASRSAAFCSPSSERPSNVDKERAKLFIAHSVKCVCALEMKFSR